VLLVKSPDLVDVSMAVLKAFPSGACLAPMTPACSATTAFPTLEVAARAGRGWRLVATSLQPGFTSMDVNRVWSIKQGLERDLQPTAA
jgi:hypothetical protein